MPEETLPPFTPSEMAPEEEEREAWIVQATHEEIRAQELRDRYREL